MALYRTTTYGYPLKFPSFSGGIIYAHTAFHHQFRKRGKDHQFPLVPKFIVLNLRILQSLKLFFSNNPYITASLLTKQLSLSSVIHNVRFLKVNWIFQDRSSSPIFHRLRNHCWKFSSPFSLAIENFLFNWIFFQHFNEKFLTM